MPASGLTSSLVRRRTRQGGSATSDTTLSHYASGPISHTSAVPGGAYGAPVGGSTSATAPVPAAITTGAVSAGTSVSAAEAAYQKQQNLLAKYVLQQAKKALVQKQFTFNAKGEATGMKESPRQFGEDLHQAAENIRKADYRKAGLSQVQKDTIQKANVKGKVVPLKGIARMSAITAAPLAQSKKLQKAEGSYYGQASTTSSGRANLPLLSGVGGNKAFRDPANVFQEISRSAKKSSYPSDLEFGLALASAPFPEVGAVVKGLEAGSEAVKATSAIGKGAAAIKAGGSALRSKLPSVLQKGESSIAARAIGGTAERVAPKTAARLSAAGTKVGETVPGASRFGKALAAKPLRTSTKTLFGAATTAAVAQHPSEQAGQVAGAVTALSHIDARDISKAGSTAAQVVTHLPRAVEYTARALTDPTVRSQTLYGLKSLGFSSIEFPVLAPYEIASKGLGPAASEFVGGYAHDISRRWTPVLQGNYADFQKQMQKDGAGGAAYMLTELLPLVHGTSVAAKAAVRTGARAGELASLPGADSLRKFLDAERPNLRRGAGAEQVRPQELSKGLIGTAGQRLTDVVGRRLHLRTEAKAGTPYRVGKKAGAVRPRPAMSLSEGERAPVSQFLPGAKKVAAYARRRGPARVVSGARNIRAMQGHEITKPMTKIEKRYADHQEVFAYAIEHGAPKTPDAMVKTLEAKRATIPTDSPEVGQIDQAIADIQAHPKLINDRFRKDVTRMQELQQTAEGRTSLLHPDQATTRRLAEPAEQLAQRPGSELPSLHEALGKTPAAKAQERLAVAKTRLSTAKQRAESSQKAYERHGVHAKAYRTDRGTKGMVARQRRDAMERRAKTDRAKVREAQSAVTKAAQDVQKAKGGRADPLNRNWRDDGRRYVQKVGETRIQAESERVGMGRPGYFPSRKRPGQENIIPQEARSKGMIPFQRSTGELARSGGRQMSAFMSHQETGRLLDTEMRRSILQRMERGYGLSLDQLRKGRETTFSHIPEDKLKGWQRVQEIRDSGYDPSQFVAMNTKTWEKRVQTSFEQAASSSNAADYRAGLFGDSSDVYSQALSDSSKLASEITPTTKGFDGNVSFVPRDEYQQATELAGLGPQVQKAFIWNRIKTLGTRFVLANPGWFAFQMYAPVFLAGIGKPSALLPQRMLEARKFVKDAPQVERDNFEAVLGLPMGGSADWNYRAGSFLGGLKFMDRMKSSDTWVKHFENRNPLDVFFSGIPRFERPIRRSMLHSAMKREAWKRMGGNVRKIGAIFDQIGKLSKEKNPTLEEFDRVMHEIAQDRPTMERLAKHVTEWLGDYETYSSFERNHLQSNLMFYGFLRHSLMLAAYTLPVKHPARLAMFAAASKAVDTNQKKMITEASRTYFAQFMVEHYGVSEAKAMQAARKLMPQVKQVPIEMMGRVMFPNGSIVDTVRASPLGNTILQAQSPTELVSLLNPAMAIPLASAFGIQPFTGAPIQKTATSAGPSLDPRILVAQGLSYISPLRLLSQAVSKYPSSERTAYSFPLPGGDKLPNVYGLDMFRETPQQYSGSSRNMEYQRQLFRRSVQVGTRGGWKTVEQNLAPFAPHATALLPAYVLGQFDPTYGALHAQAIKKRAAQADKASSKSSSSSEFSSPFDFSNQLSSPFDFGGGGGGDKQNPPTLSETGGRGYYNTIRQDLSTLLGKDFFKGATGAAAPFADTFKKIVQPQSKDTSFQPKGNGGGMFSFNTVPKSQARMPNRLAAFGESGQGTPAKTQPVDLHKVLRSIPSIGNSRQVAPTVQKLATKYNLKPSVLMAQLQQESNFTPAAQSGAGAFGESEFMPSTASQYGVQEGTSQAAVMSQLQGQAHLMSDLVKQTGSVEEALNAYYGSSQPFTDASGTGSYASKVLAKAKAFTALDGGKVSGKSGPYVSPFSKSKSFTQSRTDEGVDYTGSGLIVSPGKAKYLGVGQGPGWASGGGGGSGYGVVEKLLKGPKKGKNIFLYEGIAPAGRKLSPGDTIKKGQPVASFVPGGSIETGWSDASGAPLAQPTYNEGDVTKPGLHYQKFLSKTGAASPPGQTAISGSGSSVPYSSGGTTGSVGTTLTSSTGSVPPTLVSTAKTSIAHADTLSATQKLRMVQLLDKPGGALKLLGIPGAFTPKGTLTTDGEKILATLSADRLRLLGTTSS